jgi:hypothetical protein
MVVAHSQMIYGQDLAGQLIVLFPDGKLRWKRTLNPEHGSRTVPKQS